MMFPTDPYPFLSTTHGLVVFSLIFLALFHAVFVFYKRTRLGKAG